MADQAKGSLLTKSLKKWSRTKTKVLQNLGKAEKTFDERIDEHAHKLERQQEVAAKLHKELKGYIHCAKAMQAASKNLYQVLQETYEEEWEEYENVKAQLNSLELMWHNYTQSLHDSVNEPLNNYMSHFPTLRQRISKRGRKLTDFDNAKHNLDVLENAKKKDETKIKKAHEELEEAKKIYQQINDELNSDLPMFHESRVNFYASTFQSLFNAEEIFHGEVTKISSEINNIAEKLARNSEQLKFQPRPLSFQVAAEVNGHPEVNGENGRNSNPAESSSKSEPVKEAEPSTSDHAIYENSELEKDVLEKGSRVENKDETETGKAEETTQATLPNQATENKVNGDLDETTSQNSEDSAPSYPPPVPPPEEAAQEPVTPQKQETPSPAVSPSYETPPSKMPEAKEEITEEGKEEHEDSNLYEVPTSNKPVELPEGVLYQVQATHPYTNEDEDELSFEAGEIIYVIPFENPDDQDEGWVMGQKKSDGSKGVFPLNFSKKL
ncbi:myc box-dependent-interacting protein 1-like [Saccostrea echinata]|uniref:myc box-dependent-interacting protein 1-like n=1 Tax=Saccostrea echinata TaxID=191078 RepID=UPI002A822C3D|nr:myc box-dependent-interacting protein 1-like [Saccostrea echinata]